MSVSLLSSQELYGLFELDSAGTVLYSRHEPLGNNEEWPGTAGRNFYDDVIPFQNVEEFRRCVSDFTNGPKLADSFQFNCVYKGLATPCKVLLARIRDRVNDRTTKSVLVHLRRTE